MVRWALAQNLSSLPPNPKQAHLDRFQRDLVNVVERALMCSARSRKQMVECLLGRGYVFASVLEQVSTFDVYKGVSTNIAVHDSKRLRTWYSLFRKLVRCTRWSFQFSAQSLKDRITDVQRALVVTRDCQRGPQKEQVMARKSIIDAAITDLPFVTTCLVFRRTTPLTQGHLCASCAQRQGCADNASLPSSENFLF